MRLLRIVLGLAFAPGLLVVSGAQAAPGAEACQAAKLGAAARYYAAALKCAAKTTGSTRDARACLEKAGASLTAAHEAADAGDGCIGEPGEMADFILDQVDALFTNYVPPKVIFRTSSTFTGNLGGIEGADEICQEHAEAGGHGGTFIALISDSQVAARSRVTYSPGGFTRPDGVLVARNADDLFDGAILVSINVTEAGTVVAANTETWTGSSSSGEASSTCLDWTSDSVSNQGRNGQSGENNFEWISVYHQFCNRTNVALYCVEE